MNLAIILVNPQRAENVGAAARAMKTMGFMDLRLIGEPLHREKAAQILAHGSEDVLERGRCFSGLAEALADTDLAIGTTAKHRHQRRYHCSPQQLADSLRERSASVTQAAIIFGCEPHGLTNSDIAHCDLLSQIPLAAPQPSLNLAQAVMIYCFALSSLSVPTLPAHSLATHSPSTHLLPVHSRPAQQVSSKEHHAQYHAVKHRVAALFDKLGVSEPEKSRRWALERLAQAQDKDIKFMHFICARLEARLK